MYVSKLSQNNIFRSTTNLRHARHRHRTPKHGEQKAEEWLGSVTQKSGLARSHRISMTRSKKNPRKILLCQNVESESSVEPGRLYFEKIPSIGKPSGTKTIDDQNKKRELAITKWVRWKISISWKRLQKNRRVSSSGGTRLAKEKIIFVLAGAESGYGDRRDRRRTNNRRMLTREWFSVARRARWFRASISKLESNDLPLIRGSVAETDTRDLAYTRERSVQMYSGMGYLYVYRAARRPLTSLFSVLFFQKRDGARRGVDSYSSVRATRSRQGTFPTRNYDISAICRVIIRIDRKERKRKGTASVALRRRDFHACLGTIEIWRYFKTVLNSSFRSKKIEMLGRKK